MNNVQIANDCNECYVESPGGVAWRSHEEQGSTHCLCRSVRRRRHCAICERLLPGPLRGVFGAVHMLPFFDPDRRRRCGIRSHRPHAGRSAPGRLERRQAARRASSTSWPTSSSTTSRTVPRSSWTTRARIAIALQRAVPDARRGVSAAAHRAPTWPRSTARGPASPFIEVTLQNGERVTLCGDLHAASNRHRRAPPAGKDLPAEDPRDARRQRRAHGPAGRRGLCDQEGRHELLHDAGDLPVHRRDRAPRARARHRGAGRGAFLLSAADRNRRARRLGLRFRAAAAGAARLCLRHGTISQALDRNQAEQRRDRARHP